MPDVNGKPLRSDADLLNKTPLLGANLYDFLKDTSTIYLPALAVFYATLATIWSLPYATQVVGTLGAIAVLLGALVKISSTQNKKIEAAKADDAHVGSLLVNTFDPNSETLSLQVPPNILSKLQGKSVVTLNVDNQDVPPHV